MTENQQARKKLQDELRKLFQFDVSDLDFGIYRILNRKKVQIEKFIEKDLLDAVNVGLEAYKQQDASQTEEIKQQILDTIGPDAFNEKGELDKLYRNSPLGKKYLDALKKAEKQQVGADTEKKIYNDLDKDLLDAVNVGLEAYKQQDASQTEEIKQQILDTIGPDAFNEKGELDKLYRNSPLGKKYLDALKKAEKQQVGADTEKKIYNDLCTFFSSYYSEGDFVTKRRISTRDSKYAVPYNGEEVLLHWANKDQYYIKTGEHFTNYKFEVDGKSVGFKVAQRSEEHTSELQSRGNLVCRLLL